jgi:hypothetical protein
MGALAGFKADVFLAAGPGVPITNEATTDSGDHKTFSITNQVRRYLDKDTAVTVEKTADGTTWTPVTSGFTLHYVGGYVVFASALTGTAPGVRITGAYLPYSIAGSAKTIEINNDVSVEDSTTFADNGWITKVATLAGSSIKLTQWYIDSFYLDNIRKRLVISAYSGRNANQRIEAFAFMKSDSIKFAVDALEEESLDFDVDGKVYAIMS